MPHKHTRRTRDKDLSVFDLPPSQNAKPLPVTTVSKRKESQQAEKPKPEGKQPRKRKRENEQKDDTPRAFKRLIAFGQGKKFRSGLDDGRGAKQGSRQPKKGHNPSALGKEDSGPAAAAAAAAAIPTIKPGEKLSEYSARVDAALPLGGLINNAASNSKDPLGLKAPQTRKEKKMHKLYAQWREEDQKIRDKREEELELAEEQAMEDEEHGVTWKLGLDGSGSGKRKKAKKGKKGASNAVGGDMWEELRRKRAEGKIGLNEVAKAPPELHTGSLVKHKVVQGATVEVGSVPKAAGSLRRREELAKVREGVVASYRRLAEERRTTATGKFTVS